MVSLLRPLCEHQQCHLRGSGREFTLALSALCTVCRQANPHPNPHPNPNSRTRTRTRTRTLPVALTNRIPHQEIVATVSPGLVRLERTAKQAEEALLQVFFFPSFFTGVFLSVFLTGISSFLSFLPAFLSFFLSHRYIFLSYRYIFLSVYLSYRYISFFLSFTFVPCTQKNNRACW